MPGTAQVNVNPRKIPRQARAQATVEAIIVATAQLLTEQGFVNLTTARVAERAGVSIGSLYQYFPNKQGLAAAVVDHYSDEVLARFTAMVRARPGKTLVDTVDAMIGFALVSHPHEPEMHRALNDLAPRIGREEKTRAISRGMAKVIETELERHRQEISPDLDLADAAAMIETVLETVAHRTIQRHPVRVGADGLIGQCRRLIIGYLRSPSPS